MKTSVIKANNVNFYPEDRVNNIKKRKIILLAQLWLGEKKLPLDCNWQIDVLGVGVDLKNKKAKIRHFQNI